MKHETRCGSIEEHAVRVLEEDDIPESRLAFIARVEAEYRSKQDDPLTAAQGREWAARMWAGIASREWAESELRAAWGDR